MTDVQDIAKRTKTIALIGASNKPERASYHLMEFLLAKGHGVHPVNPGLAGQALLGQTVYASLAEVPAPVDMVDIFRNTEDAAAVVDEAIALKDTLQIKTIWCQLGVTPREAGTRAEAAGLTFVMNRCPAIDWR